MTETKTTYYLGGYYVTMLKPLSYGTASGSLVYTCSECITDHLLGTWSHSWTTNNNKQLDDIKRKYRFTDEQIVDIRNWVDSKFNSNKIGFLNVFLELETAVEYKEKFFSHLECIKIFALYFDAKERAGIIEEFKPRSVKMGEIGLRLRLLNETEEKENETFIGFDYIGIEIGGSFHTFHCHDIGKELSDKFGLTLNKFGLFDSDLNSNKVLDYLNDEENGCEPVPWFIVKAKLVTND
jgi:hypothetical protein